MIKRSLFVICGLCFWVFQNEARADEDVNTKFGKISMDEMTADVCPIDSNAYAYYIFDTGNTEFRYAESTIRSNDSSSSQKGFQLYFQRHFRIKILKKEGFDWGDFSIPLYVDGADEEKLLGFKAFTYTLEGGTIEKTKLENKDAKVEETSEHINTLKFAMPNLKEGCIIEVQYQIVSDFLFNLQEWYFQSTIPVLHSEYRVDIPEYFHYNQAQKGYFPVDVKTDRRSDKFSITYIQQEQGSQQGYKYTQDYDFVEYISEYSANNIPAFPNEKFLHSRENYVSKVEFELAYTKFPNANMHYYTTTWEATDDKLQQSYNFGRELSKEGHLKEAVEQLKATGYTDIPLMGAALNYMQSQMSWNGKRSIYTTSSVNKAFKDGEGNVADINLNLVILLRQLGFKASPLILSTQDHGIILLGRPSLTRFNYVIAHVQTADGTFLLDATDPSSFINLLPIRCLNDKGRIIGDAAEKWVELHSLQPYVSRSYAVMQIDSSMNVSGKVKKKLEGYAAYKFKDEARKSSSLDEFIKSIEEKDSKLKISDMEVPPIDSMGLNFAITYKVDASQMIMNAGDMAYLNISIDPFYDENPFKLDKREFPVEFDYPMSLQQSLTITLPENFEVSEVPETITFQLPNSAGTFSYRCLSMTGTLQISSAVTIRKDMFLPDEYAELKQFIQGVIEKQNEMIVFKSI
ncbi:DUF3857 domain-containing protein [Mangrovibacterium diazotrophicum]|uniref:Uncharacterized protein DUF3857 n=1 Tax=Mangrovibacterium diazotrophicum TaxID=1261403 RepID=A0A419VX35_9BACT|nr:DUF3857 domain-containing protein [Mangrovibacterium diazotrophicum]RKD87793.1 uncharacterized protein DUF3857 [Mangrovibacterium diazotrophicum]